MLCPGREVGPRDCTDCSKKKRRGGGNPDSSFSKLLGKGLKAFEKVRREKKAEGREKNSDCSRCLYKIDRVWRGMKKKTFERRKNKKRGGSSPDQRMQK